MAADTTPFLPENRAGGTTGGDNSSSSQIDPAKNSARPASAATASESSSAPDALGAAFNHLKALTGRASEKDAAKYLAAVKKERNIGDDRHSLSALASEFQGATEEIEEAKQKGLPTQDMQPELRRTADQIRVQAMLELQAFTVGRLVGAGKLNVEAAIGNIANALNTALKEIPALKDIGISGGTHVPDKFGAQLASQTVGEKQREVAEATPLPPRTS